MACGGLSTILPKKLTENTRTAKLKSVLRFMAAVRCGNIYTLSSTSKTGKGCYAEGIEKTLECCPPRSPTRVVNNPME